MYTSYTTTILDTGEIRVKKSKRFITTRPLNGKKLGVMLVGLGGNNGSTFTAGLLAHSKNITWEKKDGVHAVEFVGSISQVGSVHIGYDKHGKPHSKLFKEMTQMYNPDDIIVGG